MFTIEQLFDNETKIPNYIKAIEQAVKSADEMAQEYEVSIEAITVESYVETYINKIFERIHQIKGTSWQDIRKEFNKKIIGKTPSETNQLPNNESV